MCIELPLSTRIVATSSWFSEDKAGSTGEAVDWSKGVVVNAMHRQPDPATALPLAMATEVALVDFDLAKQRRRIFALQGDDLA